MQLYLPAPCWLGVEQQLPACLQETESVPGAEGAKRTATQPDRNAKRMKPLASFSESLTEEDEVGPTALVWQSSQSRLDHHKPSICMQAFMELYLRK